MARLLGDRDADEQVEGEVVHQPAISTRSDVDSVRTAAIEPKPPPEPAK